MKGKDKIESVARYLERELDSFYIIGFSGDAGVVQAFNVDNKCKELIIKHNKRFESEYICEDDLEKRTTADSSETPEQCIENLKDILKR